MTFTQGGASLALGYLLTPRTGLSKEEGPLFWFLAPDSFWQLATKSTAEHTGYQGQRPCLVGSKMRELGFSDSKYRSDSFAFLALLAVQTNVKWTASWTLLPPSEP